MASALRPREDHTDPRAKWVVTAPSTAGTHSIPQRSRRSRKAAQNEQRPSFIWRKRDGQDSRLYNLKLDINDLKQQIQQLTQLRQLLEAQVLNRHDGPNGSCSRVVQEYFRVFERGFLRSPSNPESYIRQRMSEDVEINSFIGQELVIAQWNIYSQCFPDVRLQFLNCNVAPLSEHTVLVKTTARFSGTITPFALMTMFPHATKHEALCGKLIGKKIAGEGQYDFVVNARSHSITRCEVTLDYFSVIAEHLSNPIDLCVLFNQALVLDEFYLGDVDPQAQRVIREVETESPESERAGRPAKMELGHILNTDDKEDNQLDAEPVAHYEASS
ncbi:hypothetical protein Poli38472_006785 [Pythium oligandrum]|uniref:Uncharacterized protein n=1 Tax=Pythium oligandrum TaxID=41045 RepID=A0A8K1FB08_PYTOL|nr:hypothetical protein Poli38472_006785 [Pythium oligandrum]|eukprot:TMW56775.1 hypothetical protein Poli38472_006785 [Pythium oligandrum]